MPSPDSETIVIRVSDKVLYVGSGTAYPLAGIVRVRCEQLRTNQGRHARTLLGNLLIALIARLVAQGIDHALHSLQVLGAIEVAILAFFIIRSAKPAKMLLLSRRPYYALTIDTAGHTSSRLVNRDGNELQKTAKMIIDAIDDPAAEWQVPVINYHIGDTIHQAGPASIGKVTT
jgi:hypothetical protein